jgi:hypothetical protein
MTMAKKSSTRSDYTGLKVIAQSLKKLDDGKYKIQVGVFGDKAARQNEKAGVTNAEVGFIQEMGSVSRGIPRRSFLWDTFAHHGDQLMKTLKPAVDELFKKGKVELYLKQAGSAAESLVKEAFFTSGWGSWKPNAASTIAKKGSDKPLIDRGELWQAIASRTVRA